MKKILLAVLLPCLAAPAAAEKLTLAPELTIDGKKEAAYTCQSASGSIAMTAMYGIKGGRIVAAQLKVADNVSPGLFPVPDARGNRFVSEGNAPTMWTTARADGRSIEKVDGGILSVAQGGKQAVILDNCKLDKAATAALNRK